MNIFSFAREGNKIIPIEVELSLIPGLPQVQFTGLPDTAIKESVMRIKSAIRAQGFEWPKTRQMIINLKPGLFKKKFSGFGIGDCLCLIMENRTTKTSGRNEFPFLCLWRIVLGWSGDST